MALPRGTTGSLDPTFVPARLVSLTVKPAYALAPLSRNQGFTGSCLCYADYSVTHDQSAVKVHGVFPSRCGHPASSPEPQIRRAVRQDSRSIIPPFVQVGTYPTRNFARFLLLC